MKELPQSEWVSHLILSSIKLLSHVAAPATFLGNASDDRSTLTTCS